MPPSRLAGTVWWLLIIAPALSLVEEIDTMLHAVSADAACCGMGPGLFLALIASLLAFALLVRIAFTWRRAPRVRRIEALVLGFGTVPCFALVMGLQSFVGWSNRHEVTAGSYAIAIGATLGGIGLAVWGRRRLHRADRAKASG